MHLQPANLRIIIGLHAHLLFTNHGAQTSQKNSPVEEVEDTYADGNSAYFHKGATEGGNFEGFKILTSTVEVENLNNILVLQ